MEILMDALAQFKEAQKQGWAHFVPLEVMTTPPAARLIRHARVRAGHRVLDVCCGTGVAALTASRAGASVTGLDFTPQLLERARENALRAAALAHTIGATRMLAHLTLTLADASAATGRAREAATLAAAVERVSRELGQPLSGGDEARLASLRDALRDVREDLSDAAERGTAMTTASLMEYLATLAAQPA